MPTPNLPAVRPLGVGSRVRINNPDVPHLNGKLALVTEHLPERVVTHGTIIFTALEDFTVALVRGEEIIEFNFARHELEVLA